MLHHSDWFGQEVTQAFDALFDSELRKGRWIECCAQQARDLAPETLGSNS